MIATCAGAPTLIGGVFEEVHFDAPPAHDLMPGDLIFVDYAGRLYTLRSIDRRQWVHENYVDEWVGVMAEGSVMNPRRSNVDKIVVVTNGLWRWPPLDRRLRATTPVGPDWDHEAKRWSTSLRGCGETHAIGRVAWADDSGLVVRHYSRVYRDFERD